MIDGLNISKLTRFIYLNIILLVHCSSLLIVFYVKVQRSILLRFRNCIASETLVQLPNIVLSPTISFTGTFHPAVAITYFFIHFHIFNFPKHLYKQIKPQEIFYLHSGRLILPKNNDKNKELYFTFCLVASVAVS